MLIDVEKGIKHIKTMGMGREVEIHELFALIRQVAAENKTVERLRGTLDYVLKWLLNNMPLSHIRIKVEEVLKETEAK